MEYLLGASLVLLIAILAVCAWPSVVCPWLGARAWRRLATRLGLTYIRRHTLGIPRRGRVVGVYRGREVTLDTYKEMGVEQRMRIVLSVRNPPGGSMLVLSMPWGDREGQGGDERSARPFRIVESEPGDLGAKVFASDDLREGVWNVMQGTRARNYRIELSGRVLRFEQEPRTFCFLGVDRHVEHVQALFDVLCDVAEAVEEVTGGRSPTGG
jgi:hypothetical protein